MGDKMGQKTILYVENELPLSCKVADRLTCDGYRVQMMDDPLRALRVATMLPPSLIIMNMDLLGLESAGIIDQLRRVPGLKRVPVVALTSAVLYGRAADYMAAGCDCCLFQPFPIHELMSVVHQFIGKPITRAVGITYRGSPWVEPSVVQ
jgi:CheY-like chemotaxis protein